MNLELKIVPPVQFIISSALMVSLAVCFSQYDFTLSVSLSIALLLILIASSISLLALHSFHKNQTTFHPHIPEKTKTVVSTGVFAYSRNPMYISLVLILIALGVYLQNFSSFIIIPLFVWYITRFQIIPEEKMLDKLFANDYQAYRQKVRRWL